MSSFRSLAVLASLVAAPAAALAEASSQSDVTVIRTTIERQLEAFRSNDGAAAFALAAPKIQASFGSPDRFIGLVKEGYSPVFKAKSVMYGRLVKNEDATLQLVHLVDNRDRPWLALYIMEAQADGSWRIAGCLLTGDPGADI
ncbi:DUF4864 domain-containing protein [Lacibacterium aquatile]|uniref:DUF4864 domain-containing protein n=1 Tax=Lacibacterium aquatile TaxID=1168082 RepID=A0ABW5DSM4_9PROT